MNFEACGFKAYPVTLKQAGDMVNVPLEQPVDLSQMRIQEISVMPFFTDDDQFDHLERKTILNSYVFNEYGEREELTIEFTLKSKRQPKK
jgi:hypothetical protein